MAEMKDSDIRWIGQIPKNWKVIRVKDAFTRKKAKAKQENPVILSLARSGVKVRDITNNEGQLAENYSDYNPVMVDDLLLNPMDLISGDNCNISRVEGVISPAYVNLRYKNGINPEFYNFYFKYQYWCKAFFAYGKGVSFENRWTLNYDTLERFPLILPPIEEQNRIVKFLKGKCAEIDALHTDIEKQIETLEEYKKSIITEAVTKGLDPDVEMKDSGIEWIGKIPKDWEIRKGKYTLRYLQKEVKEDDGVITCFRDGEVTLRSNRREDGFTMSDKEIGYQGIDIGDLVVHGMDGFAGAIGISDSRGKASPVLNVLDTDENKKYYMYYLRSMAYSNVFLATATGIRVRSCDLRWAKIAELPFPMPSRKEQDEIVSYIGRICNGANEIIADKKKQLETLEQYKKSVIYEYVTGKKEVQ